LLQASSPLLTVKEVAGRLGLKPVSVYKLCSTGALPFIRLGGAIRMAEADVAQLVAARRTDV
jgi:excisionase family DNA binding protein